MTMIASVEGEGLRAYIGNELIGEATKIDDLYFLTISCDKSGTVRFETEAGEELVSDKPIRYVAKSHYGSLTEPVLLMPLDAEKAGKRMINGVLYIFHNGKVYNAQGALVNMP